MVYGVTSWSHAHYRRTFVAHDIRAVLGIVYRSGSCHPGGAAYPVVLVMSSTTDPQSYPQARQFLQHEQNVPGVQPYLVQNLGHSLDAYQTVLAPILNWMAAVADL